MLEPGKLRIATFGLLPLARRTKLAIQYGLAYVWRSLLFRTTVVAITGSVGKTTAKDCIVAALSSSAPTTSMRGNLNALRYGHPSMALLRTRPWHRFAVFESAIDNFGQMGRVARLVRPDIAVELAVMRCHTDAMPDLDAIAREKAGLLQHLNPRQTAVLNDDDPRVAAMADKGRFRVVRFGSGPQCDVQLIDASSVWPDRLALTVKIGGEQRTIRTRLVGTHWAPSILASLAVAKVCGVSLDGAIAALERVEPHWGRLQPMELESGAVILRDEYNGSIDTYRTAWKILEEARAERKLMVISDYTGTGERQRNRHRTLGQEAARIADVLVAVGESSPRIAKDAVNAGMPAENAHAFHTFVPAVDFLKGELRDGDLVLLKGRTTDHLSRVCLGLLGEVTCRRSSCRRTILCDHCDNLGFSWTPSLEGKMAPPEMARR